MGTETTNNIAAVAKTAFIPALIGFGLWKLGKGNLVKAMGAGVLGVTAVSAVRSVTNI